MRSMGLREGIQSDKEKGKKIFNSVEFDYYRDDGILVGMESQAPLYYYVTETEKQNKKNCFWIQVFIGLSFASNAMEKKQ